MSDFKLNSDGSLTIPQGVLQKITGGLVTNQPSTTQIDYSPREETRDNTNYLVVPVVMMVEGVHRGSAGPVLHQAEHFAQNPSDWNGVPLTAGHPQVNDEFVSVQSADPSRWVVGHVHNTRVVDNKLKAEAWINVQRAIAVNPEIINYIKEGKKLEVSTGAMTIDEERSGQWNDEHYERVTNHYYPDHLALLPGDRGACSWQDGCGIRTNKQEEQNEMSTLKEDIKKGIGVLNGLQANEGYLTLSRKIQTMLDRMDSEAQVHYLKEIYDDHFIYQIRNTDQGTEKYYRQPYSYNEEGDQINMEGNRQEVRRNTEYVPVQSNEETSDNCGCGEDKSMARTKFNNNQNEDEDNNMSDKNNAQPSGDVMEKVVSLINNESTQFSKADREWLLQMNEAQLDKLTPVAQEPEITQEQAVQALSEHLGDTEKLLTIVSDDIKEQVQNGITAYQEQRNKLIKGIQANTDGIWSEDQLESMDNPTLENIAKSARVVDYSGQAPINNNSEVADDEMLLPAGVSTE